MGRLKIRFEMGMVGGALAVGLSIATVALAAGTPGRSQAGLPQASQVYEGIVTCSRCGARHPASLEQSASNCVRICVHGGASFALVNADAAYILNGDWTALKKLAGQRARIVGELEGKTIKVASAEPE